jgi:hypothetical protein
MSDLTALLARLDALGLEAARRYCTQCARDDEFTEDSRPCSVIRRDVADAALSELLTELELREKMVRLAVKGLSNLDKLSSPLGMSPEEWLADLRARADKKEYDDAS